MSTLTTIDLEQAYQQMYPALRHYLLRKVRHLEQADDLVQDTFVRALKALQAGTGRLPTTPEECRAWLYRIATNLAIDTWHWGKRHACVDLEAVATVPAAGLNADPQDIYPHLERAETVRAVLARLPDHYRQALVLYYFGELPISQVAHVMGLTPGGCKVLLKRARGAFAQRYGVHGKIRA